MYVVGNWKSNKTIHEAIEWWNAFVALVSGDPKIAAAAVKRPVNVVLCVPYTILPALREKVTGVTLPIFLGAQDVSPFPEGAYTGEVSARMVKELADYVIIGHSERRRYFQETDSELEFETLQAQEAGLATIYCVEGEKNRIPGSATVVAYEPPSAIGKGQAEDVGKAGAVCAEIRRSTKKPVLYGGSVNPENAASFLGHPAIDGVLLGGSSLDPSAFFTIIRIASTIP